MGRVVERNVVARLRRVLETHDNLVWSDQSQTCNPEGDSKNTAKNLAKKCIMSVSGSNEQHLEQCGKKCGGTCAKDNSYNNAKANCEPGCDVPVAGQGGGGAAPTPIRRTHAEAEDTMWALAAAGAKGAGIVVGPLPETPSMTASDYFRLHEERKALEDDGGSSSGWWGSWERFAGWP